MSRNMSVKHYMPTGAEGFAAEGSLDSCTDYRDTGGFIEFNGVDLVKHEPRFGEAARVCWKGREQHGVECWGTNPGLQ